VIKVKAFNWYGKAGDLKLEEVPTPTIGENDILIEVKSIGVCGSDLHFRNGSFPPFPGVEVPIIIGHEFAGVVAEKGSAVTNLEVGDVVSPQYVLSCGNCVYCNRGWDNMCLNRGFLGMTHPGGFAEYVVVPARDAFPVPKQIPLDQTGLIGCAITTPLHALRTPGALKVGDTVAIYGLGGIGMHAVQWAKVLGARRIIGVDVMDYKLQMAKEFGADITVNSAEEDPVKVIRDATDGIGADVVLDCVALKETILQMLRSVAKGGYAVWVGQCWYKELVFPMPEFKNFLISEVKFTGSNNHTRSDQLFAIDYIASGKYDLSKSITHRLPFEELNEGLDILEEYRDNPLRVVVTR
jgi:propanol-preferring alcohol dehydrogenase